MAVKSPNRYSKREPGSYFARRMHQVQNERGGDGTDEYRKRLESDWRLWVPELFGRHYRDEDGNQTPFAPHHVAFFDHVWSIKPGLEVPAWFSVWPRGHGKSTNVEVAVAALAAMNRKGYCIYVSGNQGQANDHVANVESMLTEPAFAALYPKLAERRENKFGVASGWTRRRIRTAHGFTIDAIGLDTTGVRGRKLEEARPDLIIFDDIDDEADTVGDGSAVEKKIKALTRRIIPAGAQDKAIIAVQNLVHSESVFSRVVEGRAGFLQDRVVSGPIPAVEGMEIDEDKKTGKITIREGTPTWKGMPIKRCEKIIADEGLESFLVERQQEVDLPLGNLTYRRSRVDAAIARGMNVEPDPLAVQVLTLDPGYSIRASMLAVQEKQDGDKVEMWKEWSFTECDDEYIAGIAAEHIVDWGVEILYHDAESPEIGAAIRRRVKERYKELGIRRFRFATNAVAFGKYKRTSIHTTRWMLQSNDMVSWKAIETEEHRPNPRPRSDDDEHIVRILPSMFKAEIRALQNKPDTNDEVEKKKDHGPDSWHAYAVRHLARWLRSRKEAEEEPIDRPSDRSDYIPDEAHRSDLPAGAVDLAGRRRT